MINRCLNITNTFCHEWEFNPDKVIENDIGDWQDIWWGRWGLFDRNGLHCYTDDWRFENIWRNPENSLQHVYDKKIVISPDFSIFPHYTDEAIKWQLYRCWQIAGFWQHFKVPVIYSINWTNPEQIARHLKFYPETKIIAVRCAGKNYEAAWRAGAEAVMEIMKPEQVLHFGTKLGIDVWGGCGIQLPLSSKTLKK
jgi:hypothetical protein